MSTNKLGLQWEPSNVGIQADALAVAVTTLVLSRANGSDPSHYGPSRHAVALHVISGKLHRIAERQCNEDLTCPKCGGAGQAPDPETYERTGDPYGNTCRACAGRGNTLGRRETALEKAAAAIATHYGLRAYFQGDPRGCSLYLLGNEVKPGEEASNYNRGHAVVRLGR